MGNTEKHIVELKKAIFAPAAESARVAQAAAPARVAVQPTPAAPTAMAAPDPSPAPASVPPPPPQQLSQQQHKVGPFEISDRLLGEGGYGRVMLARHAETGVPAACKTIVTDKPNSVMREVAAMRRAGAHGNLVQLLGYLGGNDNRTFCLVLELCEGGELFRRVECEGALTELESCNLFRGMLAGVQHLHTCGVVHRDIKLENVLLGGPTRDVPKICDLGLAHVYQRSADGRGFENPALSQWCGSRSYCPPEVLAKLPYDGYRADQWSLAVSLFAMVSGFFPVEEATQRDWRFSRIALLQLRGIPSALANASGTPTGTVSPRSTGATSTTVTVYSFYNRACPLSATLVELLDNMLRIQPPHRLPLQSVANAPWVLNGPEAQSDTYIYRSTETGAETGNGSAAASECTGPVESDATPSVGSDVDLSALETLYRSTIMDPSSGHEGVLPLICRQRAYSSRIEHEVQ